jgi:hypothetical protein
MQITYGSKLKLILARKCYREERGQANQARIKASRHDDLFYRGLVPKNLVLVEEATKVSESRLEGVNKANLKFTNLSTTTSPG